MRAPRLFERPLGTFAKLPPLMVVGALESYVAGEEYEGRLQVLNPVGNFRVEIVESSLPPGAYVLADNFNDELVLRWPAYSPPDETSESIFNGDFETGDLAGWHDLRGNSWRAYVYDKDTPGFKDIPYPPADGNFAAAMDGVGRGDHILESDKYPVTTGQPITARSLWYQGASNKGNNNLWTAFGLYRDGVFIEEERGDRIHDRTNKRRHYSSVDMRVPSGINEVTVRLIAYRRNNRNRLLNVDDVQTTGLSYSLGTADDLLDYTVTFKVTDSANRVAYWSGVVYADSVFYTSGLYPILVTDSVVAGGSLTGARGLAAYVDSAGAGGTLTGARMLETVNYPSYDYSYEAVGGAGGTLTSATLIETVNYPRYDSYGPESVGSAGGTLTAATLTVTVSYVDYRDYAPEAVGAGGTLTSARLI